MKNQFTFGCQLQFGFFVDVFSKLVHNDYVYDEYHEWQNDASYDEGDESEKLKKLVIRHIFRVYRVAALAVV